MSIRWVRNIHVCLWCWLIVRPDFYDLHPRSHYIPSLWREVQAHSDKILWPLLSKDFRAHHLLDHERPVRSDLHQFLLPHHPRTPVLGYVQSVPSATQSLPTSTLLMKLSLFLHVSTVELIRPTLLCWKLLSLRVLIEPLSQLILVRERLVHVGLVIRPNLQVMLPEEQHVQYVRMTITRP